MTKEVAIVTGAAGGIGEAIVRALGAQGIIVVGTGRNEAKLAALADAVKGFMTFDFVTADARDPYSAKAVVDHALTVHGKVTYLINNAGSGVWAPLHLTTDAMMDEVIDISLKAPFRLCREVIPHMGRGCGIVTIGSTFGIMGGMDGGIYCAVKAGLTGMTQTMAAQYGEQGIRANVVAPTVVRTPMTDAAWDYPSFQAINQGLTPFYRDCIPEDVAHAVAFLCSGKSEFINGQVLAVDGGWSTTRMINSKFMAG
jgi:meso-butanediol dehydrogenase / (S,S)-butanediol dehydrogenase / diacetyl reductase